ncbi:hypothetical protein, partial [Streptococcus suis]|uniref:hypothetical protein n=1 Tax=Streptococcus suis TaxID=1307 RepID=UPI00370B5615
KRSKIVRATRRPNNVAAKHEIQSRMKATTTILFPTNDEFEKNITMRRIPRINSINSMTA